MTDTRETAPDANVASPGRSMLESAAQMWLAGLGALWLAPLAKAQDEGARLLDLLAGLQKRGARNAQEVTPDKPDPASATWDRLEQVFDDRVGHALTRLDVPTRSDVVALQDQVAALTAAVDALSKQQRPGIRSRPPRPQH